MWILQISNYSTIVAASLELIQILAIVAIEFCMNLRLVHSALKQEEYWKSNNNLELQAIPQSTPMMHDRIETIGISQFPSVSPTSEVPSRKIKVQSEKLRLRYVMITLFTLLLVFDLAAILLFALGGTGVLPNDETINISNALMILHFFCSFKLLDLLLHCLLKLKNKKKCITQIMK
jgi:hypothetical protein